MSNCSLARAAHLSLPTLVIGDDRLKHVNTNCKKETYLEYIMGLSTSPAVLLLYVIISA